MASVAALLFILFAIMGTVDLVKRHGCLGWLIVPLYLIVLAILCRWLA